MAKKKSAATEEESLPFEAALAELQQIVEQLEGGELELEQSLTQFERGTGLLKQCFKTLQTAEQKIELLTSVDENGAIETEPFDATATIQKNEASAGRRKSSAASGQSSSADSAGTARTSRPLFDPDQD